MAEDPIDTALEEIRQRNSLARYPEDGTLYKTAEAIATIIGQTPPWTVRRRGCSIDIYDLGATRPGSAPDLRVWVERGANGHLIADGEFGRSAGDMPRLLAAFRVLLQFHAPHMTPEEHAAVLAQLTGEAHRG